MNPAVAPSPLAVDLAVFAVTEADLKVLLVRRQAPPFRDAWSLPGDAVDMGDMGRHPGEHLGGAALRVLETATGLASDPAQLHQVQTFGRAGRDPRGRVVTVASLARLRSDLVPLVEMRANADWFSVSEEVPWMRLAIDHAEILDAAVQQLQTESTHPMSLMEFVPKSFTISELQSVERAILATHTDARTFRRRFERWVSEGTIRPAPGKRHMGRARPAKVWRANCPIPGHSPIQSTG
jgi:8-oxo-dGTP diphosphatase